MRCSRFLGQILPAENPYGNQRGDCQDGEADRCEGDGGGPGRDACQGVPADLGAELHEQALSQGKVPAIEDLMIAAICKRNDCVLATRNVKDFDYLAIDVVNPFER